METRNLWKYLKGLKNKYIKLHRFIKKNSIQLAFSYHTYANLTKINSLSVDLDDLKNEKIENLYYLPANATINIRNDILITATTEEEKLNLIKKKLEKLDKLDKYFIIKLNINKRSTFNKIFENINFKNLKLIIRNDQEDYSLEEYLKEEKKLDELITPIKNANLSPLEKYLAVYNLVKNFKPYKENENDKQKARHLKFILDNEYIVCGGYTKLLIELLDKVSINASDITVIVDTSYDEGFTLEEKEVSLRWHARAIVSIDDSKYNVHGLYMSDPTWDNSLDNNYLNHALMTFDKMQISKRLFAFDECKFILDIHNFQEFNEQINFFLKRTFKMYENYYSKNNRKKTYQELLLISYKVLCDKIIDSMICDPKFQEFNNILIECENIKDYEIFLTIIGNYLLTRINKSIPDEVVLKASIESIRKTKTDLSIESLQEMENTTKEQYYIRDLDTFPYQISEDNDFSLIKRKVK